MIPKYARSIAADRPWGGPSYCLKSNLTDVEKTRDPVWKVVATDRITDAFRRCSWFWRKRDVLSDLMESDRNANISNHISHSYHNHCHCQYQRQSEIINVVKKLQVLLRSQRQCISSNCRTVSTPGKKFAKQSLSSYLSSPPQFVCNVCGRFYTAYDWAHLTHEDSDLTIGFHIHLIRQL